MITEGLKETVKHNIAHNTIRITSMIRLILIAVVLGLILGVLGTGFYYSVTFASTLRTENTWLIGFLPLGGIMIVFLYRTCGYPRDKGTNLVLNAISEGKRIPLRMTPLIFISTVITQLFGGSAGREGAALQMGGSIANFVGRLLRLDEKETKLVIMCGMSACFSALFGTPLAAAIFSIEVVSVGIMHYVALLPCAISSLIANSVAKSLGVKYVSLTLIGPDSFTVSMAVRVSVLAILCALISMLFCIALHYTALIFRKYMENPYLRVFAGGTIIVLLTSLLGTYDYNGLGTDVIRRSYSGEIDLLAFLWKIIFTCVSLAAGFKGGEIIPTFFIGATFGSVVGNLLGIPCDLAASVGMASVFCGVTNSPIASLLICFEMFGYDHMPFFLLAIGFSFMNSGYFGIYNAQKIVYSKYRNTYIDKKTI